MGHQVFRDNYYWTSQAGNTRVMRKSTRKILYNTVRALFLVGATLLALGTAAAQESELAAESQGSQVETSLGADWTTMYFFRGIVQETEGLIVQPWVDFVFPLSEGENTSFSFNIGSWNSLHDGPSGSGGDGMTMHYELDAYAGIGVSFAENWSGSLSYVVLSSPNSAFGTVKELDISLSFDDSGLFRSGSGRFHGVQPSVLVVWELDGQSDGGSDEGNYLEVGIEPSFDLIEDEMQPVSISFPISAGFSLSNYFEGAAGEDDSFGFAQGGISLSAPLNFVNARLGSWTLSGGISMLYLGGNLEEINGGENSEVILSLGVGIGL